MGCESPVGEPRLFIRTIVTTSRRQGQHREVLSEGSPSAKPRAYEQKRHRRPSRRGEWALDHETHWFEWQGKWRGCVVKVHVLIRGDLPDMRWETTAPTSVMVSVIGQKSAEGIVCVPTSRAGATRRARRSQPLKSRTWVKEEPFLSSRRSPRERCPPRRPRR